MKSKLTLILTAVALLALLALPAQAETTDTVLSGSGWSYENGVLTITANLPDYNLASSRSDWFIGTPFEKAGIDHTTTEIIVAEGVTSLGDLAFYGFSNLTKVTFPDTLTYIGSDTFRNCGALTEVTIPASVTGMGNDAFGLSHLTKIVFKGKPPKLGTWSGYYDGGVSPKAFSGASGQVYYPPYNAWTSSVIANYSNSAYLTWQPTYNTKGTAGPNATWTLLMNGDLVISGTGDLNGYTRSTAPWYNYWSSINGFDVGSGITFNYSSTNPPKVKTSLTSIAMGPGGTMDLTGQFSVDASFLMQDDYTLTIADESVATIAGHVLTAVDYGRTTLTVAAKDHPEIAVIIPVLVADEATSITLPTRLYAGVGTAIQLTATTSPASAARGLIWSVADSSLAAIDGDMLTVTATAAGSTTVTAASWNGTTASTTLHIYVPTVSKVTLAAIPTYCGVGDTLQLVATVRDNIRSYENQLVTFSSSDETVATVDANGLVTFLATGPVSFTAQSDNGKTSTVSTNVLNHTEYLEIDPLPELFVGETAQASIFSIVPGSSRDYITWSSGDETVATVDENGLVTALSAGTAPITVTSWDGLSAAAGLTVHAPVSAVSIDMPEGPLYILDEIQLTARVQCEEDFINRFVTWESSDPAIVSVDENGLAFLGGYGSATITATAINGIKAEITLTIRMEIWDFLLAQNGELYQGGTCQMKIVNLDPEDADPGITWVSADPSIVAIDENGLMTGVSQGMTDISATAWNGLSRSLTVIVNPPCEHADIITDAAVAPTDYTTGLTEGSHCDVCGKVFVAQEIIPANFTVVDGVLVAYNGGQTHVVIPADLGVTAIGEAFCCNNELVSIVIPEGVTEITRGAFANCGSLERVQLPATLRTLDRDAFYCCTKLSSINLPEGLISLGSSCFQDCENLAPIVLPDSLTTIGENCFYHCLTLTSITLPNNLQTIGNNAFYGCDSLTVINIGCASAVKDELIAQGLESKLVTTHDEQPLPAVDATCVADGLTEGSACADCGEVFTAQETIPATGHTPVIDAAVEPTDYATGLTEGSHCDVCGEIIVAQEIIPANFTVVDGVLVAYNGGQTHVVIPADLGITEILSMAFSSNKSITSLVIPEGVVTLDDGTFAGCTSLVCVTLPDSLDTIVSSAFSRCTALTTIKLPSNLERIGDNAFQQCSSLTSIALPEGITHIGQMAFYQCEKLADIQLPNTLTTLGDSAFLLCFSLKEITLPNSLTSIGSDVFGNSGVNTIHLSCISAVKDELIAQGHESKLVTTHDEQPLPAVDATCVSDGLTEGSACADCGEVYTAQEVIPATGHSPVTDEAVAPTDYATGLTEGSHCDVCGEIIVAQEVIPANFTVKDGVLVAYNAGKTDVVIPADLGITKIGGWLFNEDTELTSIVIPEGVTTIGPNAFCFCTSLTSVSLPESLTHIEYNAFEMCYSLYDLTLPSQLVSIGREAFSSSGIRNITLPATLSELGVSAFAMCQNLTCIAIPEGVTALPASLFASCLYLREVTLPSTLTTMGSEVFKTCNALTTINLGCISAVKDELIAQGHESKLVFVHNEQPLPAVDATCTADGLTEGSACADCGEVYTAQEVIPATGHTPVTDEMVDVTCTTDGLTEGSHCETCGEILVAQEPIVAIGHIPVTDEANAPTCTEDGLTAGSHCEVCGEIIVAQEVIPANGHNTVVDEAVEPTCEETGLTEGSHCDVCGEVLVAQEDINAIGHDWQNGDILVEPTCTSTGLRELICANDPTHISDRVILALPHTEVIDPSVNATCLAPGLTEGSHCEVCGVTLIEQVEIPIIPHREGTMFVAPTCTEPGEGGTYCLDCGTFTWGPEPIPALGHGYNVTNRVEPTCTEEGFCTYVCNEWNGYEHGCGDTYTDILPALGHTVVVDAAVPPTCTADGLSEGSHCDICGEILIPQSVAYATGHTEVIDAAVDVTCTTDGLTEGKHCDVCGEVLVAQEVIPAGHNEVINVITDPTCTDDGMAARACDRCYEVFEYIPIPAGHIEVTVPQVDPTCTLIGLTEKVYCGRCGEIFKDHEAIPVIPHTEVVDYGYPATDTTDGLTDGSHCSMCGQTLVPQEVIPARFTVENGVLVGARVDGPELVIPLTLRITKIGDRVFRYNDVLTSIVIPEGVTEIGSYAFDRCTALETVQLPSTLTTIGAEAFHDCTALTNIQLPSAVRNIGHHAFASCESLTSVVIPEGVTEIGAQAFDNCASLAELQLPSTLQSISYLAFGYTALTEITIPDSVTTIDTDAFEYCLSLKAVHLPDTLVSIGDYAFRGCSSLEQIELPDSLTSLGKDAFYRCSSLQKIKLSNNLTNIPEYTFFYCTQLTDVILPSNLTSIGNYAFGYCPLSKEISLPEGVTEIGDHAFYGCSYLNKVTLPASVTTMGENAFDSFVHITCDVATQGKMVAEACAESSGYYYYLSDHAYPDFQVMVDLTKDPVQMYLYDYIGSETKVALPAEVGGYPINQTRLITGWYKYDEVYCPDSYTYLGDADNPDMVVVSSWDAYARTWAEEYGLTWRHDVHTEESIPAVEATQETNGLTEGVKCAQCGEILVAQEMIPAGKHTVVIQEAIVPTCTTDGLTEGSYCSKCGEVFKMQTVIPSAADAHVWHNGVMTSAPSGDAAGEMVYTCRLCGTEKTVTLTSGIPGDANCDGYVDILDVIDMMEWFCGGAVELNLYNADVNDDGLLDMFDIVTVMGCICGWDVELN